MKRNIFRIGGLAILTALAAFTWTHAQSNPTVPSTNPRGSNRQVSPRDSPTYVPQTTRANEFQTPSYRPPSTGNAVRPALVGTSPQPYGPTISSNASAANRTYRMPANPQQIKISQLREQVLFRTEDEEQREELLTELQTLLEKSFDQGMRAQGDELAKLEERVAALKKAFERRKTNRDRVISNYVDSVRLQAEGLTIPAFGNGRQVIGNASYLPAKPRASNGSSRTNLAPTQPFSRATNAPAAGLIQTPRIRRPSVDTPLPAGVELPADLPNDDGEPFEEIEDLPGFYDGTRERNNAPEIDGGPSDELDSYDTGLQERGRKDFNGGYVPSHDDAAELPGDGS